MAVQFSKELAVATQAVRKASLLTKRVQSAVISDENSTITKSDNSPVTIGDYSAQAVIINTIKANFPNDNVVGEESSTGLTDSFVDEILNTIRGNDEEYPKVFGDIEQNGDEKVDFINKDFPLNSIDEVKRVIDFGNYAGGNKGRFWCLDPIDGTKGFLRGEQFAVCLALVIDGKVVVGVIGCPNLKLSNFGAEDTSDNLPAGYIFRAVRGNGAEYSVTTESNWTPIHVRSIEDTSDLVSLEGVEKSHSAHDEQAIIKNELGVTKSQHLDSQVKYCVLAMGLGDLYLRLPIKMSYSEKIWDHAAGNVIVEEAGGIHTDALQNVPLDFGQGRTLKTKGIIASCGPQALHTRVVTTSANILSNKST
ncbi:3'(2')5'-bisphosphate nucleotidase [Kluyveromyces marxianus]|uniref:3'(2'),5'-bisphosphate nucleotidase n=2 Tax=Kluyveromyces marxianus TaxID=4911 RepID=W0TDX5_KLUMD|nr:3'(2')5'-bisphosphate nucleotidase [Kluyveromyces marxianus DMKU3-1042]QGN17285.1 3(2)5-bisphosphate nucleotidase [Kluyveromyces marxianus]BAO41570.1 3'(2')5'-bisphosphate nucleotidase [Kluyveromyces marxianus DMKU3-1042]BAP73009.1 3'(2')5'-bisphosphate nucleotidase [Kluyveromyces marxianus]